jgi:hypothetical protein
VASSRRCAERLGSRHGGGQRGLVDADGLASRAGGSAFAGAGLWARSGSALGCAVAEQGPEGAEAAQDRAFSDTLE